MCNYSFSGHWELFPFAVIGRGPCSGYCCCASGVEASNCSGCAQITHGHERRPACTPPRLHDILSLFVRFRWHSVECVLRVMIAARHTQPHQHGPEQTCCTVAAATSSEAITCSSCSSACSSVCRKERRIRCECSQCRWYQRWIPSQAYRMTVDRVFFSIRLVFGVLLPLVCVTLCARVLSHFCALGTVSSLLV